LAYYLANAQFFLWLPTWILMLIYKNHTHNYIEMYSFLSKLNYNYYKDILTFTLTDKLLTDKIFNSIFEK
jgi:hypothetical protein